MDITFDLGTARAFGAPAAIASMRNRDEDFRVEEQLRFAPAGAGTHDWLLVEKRGLNTRDVVTRLARFAGVRAVDVGYAGQKDRYALTRQWFSVSASGREPRDWRTFDVEGVKVIEVTRHSKKLKRGQLLGNHFCVTLRGLKADRAGLENRIETIASSGVPNYFGPQRFGRGGANLIAAARMFSENRRVRDRHARGMYLSAARAHLFNQVLKNRVETGSWNRVLPGDLLMFDDSRSRFAATGDEGDADPRIARLDLHPTGPLWGKGPVETDGQVAELERQVASEHALLRDGLASAGLEADRRALRLAVRDLSYEFVDSDALLLSFTLRAGAYATTVLAELADVADAAINRGS